MFCLLRSSWDRKVYINADYELFYKLECGDSHPDEGKPFSIQRLDEDHRNDMFCQSTILFTNPNEAPEDEVALVCDPCGTGIMMEWERPISTPVLVLVNVIRSNGFIIDGCSHLIVHETARLLLEGMPKSGLRILNIGFGIGMVRINPDFLHVLFLNPTLYRSTSISKMPNPQSTSSSRATQRAWAGCGIQVGMIVRACASSRGGGKTSSPRISTTTLGSSLTILTLRRHQRENRTLTVPYPSISASLTWCTLTHSRKATVDTFLS